MARGLTHHGNELVRRNAKALAQEHARHEGELFRRLEEIKDSMVLVKRGPYLGVTRRSFA